MAGNAEARADVDGICAGGTGVGGAAGVDGGAESELHCEVATVGPSVGFPGTGAWTLLDLLRPVAAVQGVNVLALDAWDAGWEGSW